MADDQQHPPPPKKRHKARHHNGATGAPMPGKDRSKHDQNRGSGKNAPKSPKPSRRSPTEEESDAALDEFLEGSDRTSAILAPAMVENALKKGIESALHDYSDESGLFYDNGAPFGTFSAKITAGKALGLYDEKVESDLNLLREIRNQFAHALMPLRFGEGHIEELSKKLRSYPVTGNDHRNIHPSRLKFEVACFVITTRIFQAALKNWERRSAPQAALTGGILGNLISAGLKSFSNAPLNNNALLAAKSDTTSDRRRSDANAEKKEE